MPLMGEWVTITVDEDLLVQVVRELLDMATNPNHVEVVHAESGRVILVEAHLAEHWYQEQLKVSDDVEVVDGEVIDTATIVVDAATTVSGTASAVIDVATTTEVVDVSNVDAATTELPVKRGPGRPRNAPPPSASPDGEEP